MKSVGLNSLSPFIDRPQRRRVFISYHHGGDRSAYEQFVNLFSAIYELVDDNSVEREIDNDNSEYVIRAIRERYITGSSCTIVLCGRDTPWRKFVDWEIKATLDKQHALLGVILPTCRTGVFSLPKLPDRLDVNFHSGYSTLINLADLLSGRVKLGVAVEQANRVSKGLIRNEVALMARNGTPPVW